MAEENGGAHGNEEGRGERNQRLGMKEKKKSTFVKAERRFGRWIT